MLRSSRLCWCLLGICAALAWADSPRPVDSARAKAALAAMPLRYETNQGQWQPDVRFAARTGGYTVALTEAGASLRLRDAGRVDLTLAGSKGAEALETKRSAKFLVAETGAKAERAEDAAPTERRAGEDEFPFELFFVAAISRGAKGGPGF